MDLSGVNNTSFTQIYSRAGLSLSVIIYICPNGINEKKIFRSDVCFNVIGCVTCVITA